MIRSAREEDAEEIVNLIRELAEYERLPLEAKATAKDIQRYLFSPRPSAEALIAEVDNQIVGMAIFFSTFSTFRGQAGLYLEDLFVKPAFRGRGIGKGMLATLAQLAVQRDCGRLEWAVLDWNEPSIAFYKAHGARAMDEWTTFRVDDEALHRLASQAPLTNVRVEEQLS